MKVKEFLNHLDGVHELVFYGTDGKRVFSCESDSYILEKVEDWNIMSFRTGCENPRTERSELKIIVSSDIPFE